MKKFNFTLQAVFNGRCTIKANSRREACEILEKYLYTNRAKLEPDACADEAKNIIDYEIETSGTIIPTHLS